MGKTLDKKGKLDWWESTQVREPRINNVLPNKESVPSGFYHIYDEFWEPSFKEDTAWTSVSDLVKTLLSLAKIVYNCPSDFSPNVKPITLKFRLQPLLEYPTHNLPWLHPHASTLSNFSRLLERFRGCR